VLLIVAICWIVCGQAAGESTTAPAAPENLVANPSFEERQDQRPAKWESRFRSPRVDERVQETEHASFSLSDRAHTGAVAACITASGLSNETGFPYWQQTIPVRPGSRYYFSAMLRTEGKTWTNVTLVPLTRQQAPAAGTRPAVVNISGDASTEFVKAESQFETDSDTELIRIELRLQAGAGTAWFDDVRLVEIPSE
jgi:hypothetical protein